MFKFPSCGNLGKPGSLEITLLVAGFPAAFLFSNLFVFKYILRASLHDFHIV